MKFLLLMCCLAASAAHAELIRLNTSNTVNVKGEVSDASVASWETEIIKQVDKRGNANYTIYLVIDSPGGSIDAGEDFIAFAKHIRGLETVTLFGASMASAIVEGLPGNRAVTANGTLMFHRAKGGIDGQFEDGELESRLAYIKSIVRGMEIRNCTRMHMELATYKSAVKDELWLYGADAVSRGAADAVVDVVCSRELISEQQIIDFEFLGSVIKLKASACPLLKSVEIADGQNKVTVQKYKQFKLNGAK